MAGSSRHLSLLVCTIQLLPLEHRSTCSSSQVEYAGKAVENSGTTLAICCKDSKLCLAAAVPQVPSWQDGVVFAAEKFLLGAQWECFQTAMEMTA